MLKTFAKGGVHPSENKITAQKSIVDLSVPATVTIPLAMHLGVPAKPIVEKGESAVMARPVENINKLL